MAVLSAPCTEWNSIAMRGESHGYIRGHSIHAERCELPHFPQRRRGGTEDTPTERRIVCVFINPGKRGLARFESSPSPCQLRWQPRSASPSGRLNAVKHKTKMKTKVCNRIVYKLVADTKEGYKSALVEIATGCDSLALPYEIGKTTRPRFGLLFAFATKANAEAAYASCSCTTLRCKATGVRRPPKIDFPFPHLFLCDDEQKKALWAKLLKGEELDDPNQHPKGTLWCSSITPLEVA